MNYAKLVVNSIYDYLWDNYDGFNSINKLKKCAKFYPTLSWDFSGWLIKYSNIDEKLRAVKKFQNKIIYDINNPLDYKQAIIDYISGMSDNYAIKAYDELIEF